MLVLWRRGGKSRILVQKRNNGHFFCSKTFLLLLDTMASSLAKYEKLFILTYKCVFIAILTMSQQHKQQHEVSMHTFANFSLILPFQMRNTILFYMQLRIQRLISMYQLLMLNHTVLPYLFIMHWTHSCSSFKKTVWKHLLLRNTGHFCSKTFLSLHIITLPNTKKYSNLLACTNYSPHVNATLY